jgi:hypothetical protein
MINSDASWRVRVGPAIGCGPQTLEAARSVLPSTEGYVIDGELVIYVKSLEVARAVVEAQDRDTVLWNDISTWAEGPNVWQRAEGSGDPGVSLYAWHADNNWPARAGARSLTGHPRLIPVMLGSAAVLAFFLVYFIGGTPGSSVGDHPHNLAAAVTVALCCLIVPPVILRQRRSRN